MNDSERVADRRIDVSLPIVEGSEEIPDLTEDILVRLRAEGLMTSSPQPKGTWIAAALVLLGIGVALGVALQRWADQSPLETTVADQASPPGTGTSPTVQEIPSGTPALQIPSQQTPARQEPGPQDPGGEGIAHAEASRGNSWFERTELDLGTIYNRGNATGSFRFANPSGETRQLTNLRQSCTCTRTTLRVGDREYYLQATAESRSVLYRVMDRNGVANPERVDFITVGPGEEGTVEVEMEMVGIKGLRSASISFQTTDPDLPFVTLRFQAMGATYFTVIPEEVNLSKMVWSEKREFTARVTSPIVEDFNIVDYDPLPEGMRVSYEKSLRDGRAEYTINGSYGPLGSDAGNGGRIVFHTDIEDLSFSLPVLAMVEGPLRLQPGSFLSLGRIPKDRSVTRSVTLEPTDDFELRVEKLEVQKLSFDEEFLEISSAQRENSVEVTIRILPGIPAGTVVRGDLVVHLNHPAANSKTILFNGFVR